MNMKHRRAVHLLLTCVGIGMGCMIAYGLWGAFPNDQPITDAAIPKEILAAVNAQRRVYAYASYPYMAVYFEGDAADLNKFLREAAGARRAKSIWLEAEFEFEEGSSVSPDALTPIGEVPRDGSTVKFDWSLGVEQTVPELATWPYGSDDGKAAEQLMVTVHIPLKGRIRLDQVKLPLEYEAKMGGRLAEFVALHNERRTKRPGGQGAILRDLEPTTTELLPRPGGLGIGTSRPAPLPGGDADGTR